MKKSTTVFETVLFTISGKMAASTLIFNSLAMKTTVSNFGLLWQFSKSMVVWEFILIKQWSEVEMWALRKPVLDAHILSPREKVKVLEQEIVMERITADRQS